MVVEAAVAESKKYFEVTKSENDPRKYRFLELANRIKILLISDDLADKSAASVDVNIGIYFVRISFYFMFQFVYIMAPLFYYIILLYLHYLERSRPFGLVAQMYSK